ncbi:putative polyketide synthase [Paramyrothecium foliicola]|nr:putative polyketide synthase [Paramyrothecium foliicola]
MSPSVTRSSEAEASLEPIAICGMSCRLPGGIDSTASFWDMLVEKRTGQTPKVPASRFNIDAHLHENPERPGSFNVPGGYFLDGKPSDFDPTFFKMTPVEAQWLDPQQRRMLEVSYECLESAGATLESVAGTNTAVFVGSFTSDFQQMSIRDPDFRHNYAATGVDTGIISNRIGNMFNLNGPSFTINTACSSSVYAIHNACHALRARDCEAAIVGGVNLIITVDQHMNTAKLGILSPTSTCHTFDASADGYGRAEGAGALYMKRLSDAIRDGDPIRSVIRSTAVNTNGKVEGMGITHPSVKGQERVVRLAYEKANLDPTLTTYAELHGTGTPVGDPIEVRAISRALNDTRPNDKPLLIGAVKPNIGHSEAASGIFAVMKASMMTEAARIPGVALFERLNPNILENEWNVKVNVNTAPWPSDAAVRRASVSSFGYGGTNGHVIVEAVESLYPWYQHAKPKDEAFYDRSTKKPFLLCFSAHDDATLGRNVQAIANVAHKYFLTDLSHTLNLHRSMFSHRAFTIAREGQEAEYFDVPTLQKGVVSAKKGVCFLFTGQGAQWAGMGRTALKEFPLVLETLQRLDIILQRLEPRPSFSIVDLLQGEPEATAHRIAEAEVSQPLCTAIQIALVDLFSKWDILPEVSIGHSSGEIGAAYAAGLISAPEAILAAFCRGRAVHEKSPSGAMLAVGLGRDDVQRYLPESSVEVCIACENSPSSVTLSGQVEEISKVYTKLREDGVFARELKTGRAYHSPHMAAVGPAYDDKLAQALAVLSEDDLLWCRSRSEMISSVTGEQVRSEKLPPGYWRSNLEQRVLFDTAVQLLGSEESYKDIGLVVEIGPHAALSGPFKQICLANKFKQFSYIPSLVRNKDDAAQLLSAAGSLFNAGYPVDLEEVNEADYVRSSSMIRKPKTSYLLVDLPPYQWNYEKQYWTEPRASAEQRGRIYPRHDLLGSRVSGLSTQSKVWTNTLRHRDIPWLKDHSLGGTAIFPAAGHLSLAIEALRQTRETEGVPFEGVTLRDIDIKTALVVPNDDDGIEIAVRLQPTSEPEWHSFSVESLSDNVWTSHCEGRLSASKLNSSARKHPVVESALTQRVSGKRWYSAFHRVGFNYANTFQQLRFAKTNRTLNQAAGDIAVLESSGAMQGESRYLIHPSTIDACLQLIIISIHSGKHKEMPWGVVPTRIEEVSLDFAGQDAALDGHSVAWTDGFDGRRFNTNVILQGKSGRVLMDIRNLTCVSYEAALPAGSPQHAEPKPFSVVSWLPDIMTLTSTNFKQLWPTLEEPLGRLTKLAELICFRQPVQTVLIAGSPSQETVIAVCKALPVGTQVTVGFSQENHLPEDYLDGVIVKTLGTQPKDWVGSVDGLSDVVLIDYSEVPLESQPLVEPTKLLSMVNENGWILGSSDKSNSSFDVQVDHNFAMQKIENQVNGIGVHPEITVLSTGESELQDLGENISSLGRNVTTKQFDAFTFDRDGVLVIDDTAGTLFSTLDAALFESLKAIITSGIPTLWLTKGVKQGNFTVAGMAEGFLRVIRSEQAAAKIVLLDFDAGEDSNTVAQAVVDKLDSVKNKDSGADTEFWLHQGSLHINRVHANKKLNQEWDESRKDFEGQTLTHGMRLKARISDEQLVFEPESESTLDEAEIEIEVEASELETSPGSQMLLCGRVLEVGASIDSALIGKRAIAFAYDQFRTIVRTSAYAIVDDELISSQSLVGTLSTLLPVANVSLVNNALKAGDQVVLLPSPEAFTSTIALLAGTMKWNLSLVAKSEDERTNYMSKFHLDAEHVYLSHDVSNITESLHKISGNSTLLVITHDFDALGREVWRGIPANGKFALVDGSLDTAPDALPFAKGAQFNLLSMKNLRAQPRATTALLNTAHEVLQANPDLSDGLETFYDSSDVSEVFETVDARRNKKIVVICSHGNSQIKVSPDAKHLSLSPDASYLLVGCLGGLGRSLTKWMMDRGARHFALVSRSGVDKPEASRLVDDIKEAGAVVKVFRADASDEDAMKRVVTSLREERPIRGVVHAAMVLKDGMFEQMDFDSFTSCVSPKVKGAISLHSALQGVELDFFVMTSSISALLGNTGQSNYSAANAYLDSLALQRNRQGLVATSLVLPMVLDVGVVAENEAIETSLARKGLYGVDEREMLRGFEVAMSHSVAPADECHNSGDPLLVMGMEPTELANSMSSVDNVDAYWYEDARFCHIRAAIEALNSGGSSSSGGDKSFSAIIKAAQAEGPDAVTAAISAHIVKRVSSILMIPVEDFDVDGPSLASYGLDSMIGAELRTWLFKEFGLDYPFQKLLAPTLTFNKLAGVVAENMGL